MTMGVGAGEMNWTKERRMVMYELPGRRLIDLGFLFFLSLYPTLLCKRLAHGVNPGWAKFVYSRGFWAALHGVFLLPLFFPPLQ